MPTRRDSSRRLDPRTKAALMFYFRTGTDVGGQFASWGEWELQVLWKEYRDEVIRTQIARPGSLCTRPWGWREWDDPLTQDVSELFCEYLHRLGELSPVELAAYPQVLAEAEARFQRAEEWYEREHAYEKSRGGMPRSGPYGRRAEPPVRCRY